MKHHERIPENKYTGEFAPLKEELREYILTKYSLQDGKRFPIKLEESDKYLRQALEPMLTALESEDVDVLDKLAKQIDNWFVYINEKDRVEGAKTKALREKLLALIDTILAR